MTGRILIADDDATHRIILKARLSEAAYDVSLARDAAALMDLSLSAAPDVVLLASDFDGQDALALVRRLRTSPGTAAAPVVLLAEDLSKPYRPEARP